MGESPLKCAAKIDLAGPLREVFGFHSFRPNQEEIVRAVLAGRDVFAVMPTGGGKSLCYQLPACVLKGLCVVVSPLISLMKDQVDAAKANGLRAEYLNSSLDAGRRADVFRSLAARDLDLLYLAPERFAMDGFAERLQAAGPRMFAVDEAHCISEWGHDFRPDYLTLSRIVELFPQCPVAAFTATATPRVQDDIIDKLQLRQPHVVRASFDRPNLFYQVLPKHNAHRQLLAFLRDRPGQAGIVYRTTRNAVELTAAHLASKGIRALPYHAGLSDEKRHAHQEAFNRDEADVIVATIAFGMGIDKSNVRFIVHADLPKNLEGYYQETGRAGRDGEPAHCLLLFGVGDIPKIRYFIDQMEDDALRATSGDKLNEMVRFATVNACRRRSVLAYFGEQYGKDSCGTCDVCSGEVVRVEATTDAQILMSAVARTGERFGAVHVIDIVTGADTDRIRQLGHDRLKTYAAGKGKDKRHWRSILDELIAQGCLLRTDDQYPVLKLTDKGREVLFGRQKFHVLERPAPAGKKKKRLPLGEAGPADASLFERLRRVRQRIARAAGVPPYIVFSDRTLRDMSARQPTTPGQMSEIVGVGATKLLRYGKEFLDEVRLHLGNG